jgi:hypothetical protein
LRVVPCKAKIYCSAAEDKLFIPNWLTVNNLLAFAKLRTANIDLVISVSPSVRTHGTAGLPMDEFP